MYFIRYGNNYRSLFPHSNPILLQFTSQICLKFSPVLVLTQIESFYRGWVKQFCVLLYFHLKANYDSTSGSVSKDLVIIAVVNSFIKGISSNESEEMKADEQKFRLNPTSWKSSVRCWCLSSKTWSKLRLTRHCLVKMLLITIIIVKFTFFESV